LKYHGLVKIILSPGDAIDVSAAQNAWLDPDVIPILVELIFTGLFNASIANSQFLM